MTGTERNTAVVSFPLAVFPSSHQVSAGDSPCQQHSPQGNSCGRHGTIEGLVVGVCDDMHGSAVGLLTGWLDLILGKHEAKCPIISQLKGVGEGDPLQTSPVSG